MERTTNIDIEILHKLTDIQAYIKFHNFNFIYNKLELIKSQSIPCAPVGIYPTKYPIVIKPILNLFGMSHDVMKINSDEEYETYLKQQPSPSNFWMPYLTGNHYTIDLFLWKGEIIFTNSFQSFSSNNKNREKHKYRIQQKNNIGIFKEHRYIKSFVLSSTLQNFVSSYVKNYTGCLNIEVINNIILEMHLRWNGDNFIYRENSSLFQYLDEKIYMCQINNNIKSYLFKFHCKECFYIPIFIFHQREKETIQRIMKEYKKERIQTNNTDNINNKKNSTINTTNNVENNTKIKIYYDDLNSIKQQEIKRYCVVVFYDKKEKDYFIEYLYKNGC